MSTKKQLVEELNDCLANLQVFYQNLRGLHWNIKGAQFFTLHATFEAYYDEVAEWVDEVAERILMIGGEPVHAFSDYLKISMLKEVKNVSGAKESVQVVKEGLELLLNKLNKILADSSEDEGTNALASGMIGNIEKKLWMLGAYLA